MDNWLFMLVINQWARRIVRMPALLLETNSLVYSYAEMIVESNICLMTFNTF